MGVSFRLYYSSSDGGADKAASMMIGCYFGKQQYQNDVVCFKYTAIAATHIWLRPLRPSAAFLFTMEDRNVFIQ